MEAAQASSVCDGGYESGVSTYQKLLLIPQRRNRRSLLQTPRGALGVGIALRKSHFLGAKISSDKPLPGLLDPQALEEVFGGELRFQLETEGEVWNRQAGFGLEAGQDHRLVHLMMHELDGLFDGAVLRGGL